MATDPPPGTATPVSTRERLLDAAEALIYAGGIHATGVDAIVKRSGTARKSFYTHFESKDALVAAALERRDARWMNWFIEGTNRRGKTARKRLLGMFDVLREWFMSEDFHGCAFLNAAGEIASAEHPVRIVAREHKARLFAFVESQFTEYAERGGFDADRVARLSRQWLILLDGAIAVALVSGQADAALDARAAAAALLDDDLKASTRQSANPTRTRRPPTRRSEI
ncbi:TetR/AcrR family transcriptional regulator [Paraburkholderia sp. PREW-6R]|uniref:TetR/AcrR family transcriptional regulator n=1 Tax=Paraburkholderia sp. PREW-6R TaxID=3141544 RepID=UPI0031F5C8F8